MGCLQTVALVFVFDLICVFGSVGLFGLSFDFV